jgi:hypothetical protein
MIISQKSLGEGGSGRRYRCLVSIFI